LEKKEVGKKCELKRASQLIYRKRHNECGEEEERIYFVEVF
jgi:hypothetical protein